MTMLSIIIPVYNQSRYLSECLESVLAQHFADFEVICVDDGSTDDSLAILKQYSAKDNRIRIISTSNSGYGSAMNIGLKNANGTYIGIVESDDSISPCMYEELITKAQQMNADIVKCSFLRIFSGGSTLQEKGWNSVAGKLFKLKEAPEVCRLHPAIWAAVYKRQLLEKNNITFSETPGASYQDIPFFADAYSAAERIFVLKKALYYYRIESANKFSSSNTIDEKVFYRLQNHQAAKEIYIKHRIWDNVKYAELQRQFITLNGFALRANHHLRHRIYNEIGNYFSDIPASDSHKFLPPNYRRPFKLAKKGSYRQWLLRYALGYIIMIRISKILGLTDVMRKLYLKWRASMKVPL
ncbi:MAG: glycosyltransferase [Planctomycetota bacterium]|jgi:glycosyltransferase involved in cell wall biosynthesis